MNCIEFAKWLENRDIHDISEADRALKHAALCQDCAHLLRMDEQIDTLVRKAMQRVAMPEALPGSIDLSLERTRVPSSGRKYGLYGVLGAVAALLTVFFVAFLVSPSLLSLDDMGRFVIADHRSHDTSVLTINSIDGISRLSGGKIGFAEVRSEVPENSVFIGGRLCPLGDNCLAIHLVFSHNGKIFSLYLIEEKDVSFSGSDGRYYLISEGGENVRFWKKGDYVYGLTG
ncbi:MAG: hypothetical protein V2I36_09915 [Desulfopila sp.]|jgi:hypothetical protein|nr:hypothetical protein [Desulfopila sp.]